MAVAIRRSFGVEGLRLSPATPYFFRHRLLTGDRVYMYTLRLRRRIDARITRGQFSVFSVQYGENSCRFAPLHKWEYDHAQKRCTGKALRTATTGAGSCTSPNSPGRRSPRRLACTAPSFPAICNRPATYAAAGIPPILKWRALLRRLSGNGDRHPTGCMRLRTGTLHPGASPHFRSAIAHRGGGRILERKEDLRPAGRWIRPPTEVVNSICNLTQFNAI